MSLGRREKSLARLDEARAAYNQALAERRRDREPIQWAATQAALGLLHYFKGEMERGTESLERAAQHYKSVLEEERAQVYPFASGRGTL